MRPQPPKIVTDWEKIIRTPPPKCCHTCFAYNKAGQCMVFHMAPPAEFAEEVDKCSEWEQDAPF